MSKNTEILIDVHDDAALKDAANWMHPDLYKEVKARAEELKKAHPMPAGDVPTFHNVIRIGIPAIGVVAGVKSSV
jgi:hypothetical protein